MECIYSTASPKAVQEFVAQHFEIGAVTSCKLLRRGLNDTFTVEAKAGPFLLRISRHGRRSAAALAAEADFLAHLKARAVPVAAAVPSRDGAYVVAIDAPEGKRLAMLFSAAPGRLPEATVMDARAHGETLAAIHSAGADFEGGAPRAALDLAHLLSRPVAALEPCFGERTASRAFVAALAAKLETLARERADDLTRGQLHGDCHGVNARIGSDGTATFFDFDDGGSGWVAYDLAVFLWNGRAMQPERRALWRPFLDAYAARRPLSAADRAAIPIFVPIRHLWLMGEWAEGADGWGREWLGAYFDRQIEFLREWEAEQLAAPLGLGPIFR